MQTTPGYMLQQAMLLSLLSVGLALATVVQADEIKKRGDAYVVYLPGDADFSQVVDTLKTEILAANWDVTNVQDVDVGLRQYGLVVQNKVIAACKSQLLKKAIREDPYISLVVPCHFTVFRESEKVIEEEEESEPAGELPGRIVVGFHDPAAEAKDLKIENHKAAKQATKELKGVLERMVELYGTAEED